MPDARLQQLYARKNAIDSAIDALIEDRAERASFEGWQVDRIQLERLQTARSQVNYQITRRLGQLNSIDVNFGAYRERVSTEGSAPATPTPTPTPVVFTFMAGLSDDAIPEAAEFTIDDVDGEFILPIIADKYVLLWRLASEGDITSLLFTSDRTHENQLVGFTKYGSTVTLAAGVGSAWVSDHALTFTSPKTIDVA